jgi:hypothetical protein
VLVPCFLLFLCFRKVTQEIFSELDKTKAEHPDIKGSFQNTEEEKEPSQRVVSPPGARPRAWPRRPMVSPTWSTSDAAPSPIKTPNGKNLNTWSIFQKHIAICRRRWPEIGRVQKLFPAPSGEGNRHRRSSSSPCLPLAQRVSSLPWTMGP